MTSHGGWKGRQGGRRSYQNIARRRPRVTKERDDGQLCPNPSVLPRGDESASNSHSINVTPFKVQVNFEIPIFEGQIDTTTVDKWSNVLEGYFLFMIFLVRKRLFSLFSKQPPTSRIGGKPTTSRRMKVQAHYFQPHPLGIYFGMPSRSSTTLSKAMRINT